MVKSIIRILFVSSCLNFINVNAESLAIENHGFEALYQGIDVLTGSFPVGNAPEGWTRYDENGSPIAGSFVGVLNPGTQADYDADGAGLSPCFPGGAPEGDNVALLFKSGPGTADEYGIEQVLDDVLQANTEYTLTVEVGNIQTCAGLPPGFRNTFVLDGFPGYRIELRAGGEILAVDNNSLLPNEGTFETSSFSYVPPDDHIAIGQQITIRLVSLNNAVPAGNLEVDFDNVRLETNAIQAVPMPFMAYWLIGALFILIQWRRN